MIAQRTSAEPSIVRRAAELWPEGVEEMPYASSWKPLYPFPGSPVMGGTGGASAPALASQVAAACDLSFTRGDTVDFQFFFPGVCWTMTEPTPAPPVPWEGRVWNAQIRDTDHGPNDPCCYINAWIPAWGTLPTNAQVAHVSSWTLMTEFMCVAEFIPVSDDAPEYATFGTMVTISLDNTVEGSGSLIHPDDDYKWDLQMGSDYILDAETDEIIEVLDPVTVLGGTVTVMPDYTYSERVLSS